MLVIQIFLLGNRNLLFHQAKRSPLVRDRFASYTTTPAIHRCTGTSARDFDSEEVESHTHAVKQATHITSCAQHRWQGNRVPLSDASLEGRQAARAFRHGRQLVDIRKLS